MEAHTGFQPEVEQVTLLPSSRADVQECPSLHCVPLRDWRYLSALGMHSWAAAHRMHDTGKSCCGKLTSSQRSNMWSATPDTIPQFFLQVSGVLVCMEQSFLSSQFKQGSVTRGSMQAAACSALVCTQVSSTHGQLSRARSTHSLRRGLAEQGA